MLVNEMCIIFFIHVDSWPGYTATNRKWKIQLHGPFSIRSFNNNNPVLFLVEFFSSQIYLVCRHSYDLENRMYTQKCSTLINYAMKKEAGYIFDFLIWLLLFAFPIFHMCHHSLFSCKFFNSLSLLHSWFLYFWPQNSWITTPPLVTVFKLIRFMQTFQEYIHQQKIVSANKNHLFNLLMHVWKIQKVWDQYKNNLKQKAEDWERRKYT